MVDDWRKALGDNKLVGAVMVDLSKAFDMINHSILLRKMDSYGVRGKELRWFQDYLTGRRQRVCVGDEKSEWTNIRRGVPQGSILGPLLFTMYVNDCSNWWVLVSIPDSAGGTHSHEQKCNRISFCSPRSRTTQ